jgi:hypothetical protein
LFYYEDANNYCNCVCGHVIEGNLTLDQIKNDFAIPKVIKKFKDFRMSVVTVGGMKFWKKREPTEANVIKAAQQIKLIEQDMNNEEDIAEFVQQLSAVQLPRDSFPWELHVKENYQGDKTLVMIKLHHALVDGMGAMLLTTGLNDCLNDETIPQMKDISIFTKVVLSLLSPLLFLYSFYLDYFIKTDDNPFKLRNGYTGQKVLKYSKTYDFSDLQ